MTKGNNKKNTQTENDQVLFQSQEDTCQPVERTTEGRGFDPHSGCPLPTGWIGASIR